MLMYVTPLVVQLVPLGYYILIDNKLFNLIQKTILKINLHHILYTVYQYLTDVSSYTES